MANVNLKNFGLTPAATDLGLASQLQQQVEDEIAARKQKNNAASPMMPVLGGFAAQALFSKPTGTGV